MSRQPVAGRRWRQRLLEICSILAERDLGLLTGKPEECCPTETFLLDCIKGCFETFEDQSCR